MLTAFMFLTDACAGAWPRAIEAVFGGALCALLLHYNLSSKPTSSASHDQACNSPSVLSRNGKSSSKQDFKNTLSYLLSNQNTDVDTFTVFHLFLLKQLHDQWREAFPTIQPYYAIKCNPDPKLIVELHQLGVRFDCASYHEVQLAISLGVPGANIIFANTCKKTHDMQYASAMGVHLTTVDCTSELTKIARDFKHAKVLVRIECDDPHAIIPFHGKFGAREDEWPSLLETALALQVDLVGVAFHVGSGCSNPQMYARAIARAHAFTVLASSRRYGFQLRILDIGGGFSSPIKCDIAHVIRASMQEYFGSTMTVIAEPGRYFAESVCTHYTRIIGTRARGHRREVWIDDSIYGSFVDAAHGYFDAMPERVHETPRPPQNTIVAMEHETVIYGSTCDGADVIVKMRVMPELHIGDWLRYHRMGAYTNALASSFNGMNYQNILRVYE